MVMNSPAGKYVVFAVFDGLMVYISFRASYFIQHMVYSHAGPGRLGMADSLLAVIAAVLLFMGIVAALLVVDNIRLVIRDVRGRRAKVKGGVPSPRIRH